MPATPKKTAAAAVKKAPPKVGQSSKAANRAAAPKAGKYNLGSFAAPVGELYDLRVPSGALCQAKRPGVQGLLKAGLLDKFDSLTALVQTEHIEPNSSTTGKKGAAEAAAIAGNPKAVTEGFALIDALVVEVVVQPALYNPHPLEGETEEATQRRVGQEILEGKISTEAIDLVDKIFIMNWAVGGSGDLEAFRQGLGEGLDDLSKLQGL